MHRHLNRLWRETDGGAAVELGIIFPIFVVMVLGIIEYGMVMFQMMNVSHAAQVGAQVAVMKGYDVAKIQTAVSNATGLTPTVAQQCGCAAAGGTLTAVACPPAGQSLPVCQGGLRAGAYVTVNVQSAYSPVAPGIPSPLRAQTTVRVQ
jgi:Flp pilus assembly protein TadG